MSWWRRSKDEESLGSEIALVVAIAAVCTVVVLGVSLLTGQIPALGHLIATSPVVVILLIVVTGVLVFRAVRRSRGR
jgi:choline-glycine betaine transporter